MILNTPINGVAVGVTNVGPNQLAVKVTLDSATTAIIVSAILLNGAGNYNPSSKVRIWFMTFPTSMTAANVPARTQRTGNVRYIDLAPRLTPAAEVIVTGEVEPIAGGYAYVWADLPETLVDQTLTVYLTELP